jgi:hypothetical protein
LAAPGAIVAEKDSEVTVTPSVPGGSYSGAEVSVDDYEDVLVVADCDDEEGDGVGNVDGLHGDGRLLETVLEDEDGTGVPLTGVCLFMRLDLKTILCCLVFLIQNSVSGTQYCIVSPI